MDYNDREFHISRILSPHQKIKIGREFFWLLPLSREDRYNSNIIYKSCLRAAIKNGAATDDQLLNILIDNGLWTDEDEKKLNQVTEDIEKFKLELYQSDFKSTQQIQLKEYLKQARTIFKELSKKRNQFDMFSANGIAAMSKLHYIIGRSLRRKTTNERVKDSRIIAAAVFKYNSLFLTESQYRELARTDPWRNLWCISKGNKLFSSLMSELTDEQRILLSWSRIYDSVYKHPYTPSDDVINNDDLLDGWFIFQRQQREKENLQRKADEYGEKHPNAQEIFVPAETLDDAKKIDSLNDTFGKVVKRQRFNQLKDAGTLKHDELADVKKDIMMQAARQAGPNQIGK